MQQLLPDFMRLNLRELGLKRATPEENKSGCHNVFLFFKFPWADGERTKGDGARPRGGKFKWNTGEELLPVRVAEQEGVSKARLEHPGVPITL